MVEDHAFQRRALSAMLARAGATGVLEAADGRSALQKIDTARPPVDIVISDLDMPGMDGIELIRHLGACGRPVSIIVMSAMENRVLASVESMAAAYGIALLGVLTKPVTQHALQALIERHQPSPHHVASGRRPAILSAGEVAAGLLADQFEPFMQPQVEFASGRVSAFEALARWRHPDAGVLGPPDFLRVMEDEGLIDDLTWVMLRKSAAACRRWQAAGLELRIAVNLSMRSLADVRLADRLAATVAQEGIRPGSVILELTESDAAGESLGPVLENLVRLRLKGFGLAIDDFGTGYASVQQLARVAFTELKIDRSFVRHAAGQAAAMILLQSTLEMARRLELRSVAEGIETRAEWDLLQRLGCDLAQGYYIAAPMEAGLVPAWVHRRHSQGQPVLSTT